MDSRMARLALSTAPTIRSANCSVVVIYENGMPPSALSGVDVDNDAGDHYPALQRLRPRSAVLRVHLTDRAQHQPVDITGPLERNMLVEHRQQRLVEQPIALGETRFQHRG